MTENTAKVALTKLDTMSLKHMEALNTTELCKRRGASLALAPTLGRESESAGVWGEGLTFLSAVASGLRAAQKDASDPDCAHANLGILP
jgi:hypothetical protein